MPGEVSRINGQKGGRPKGSENSDTKTRREMKNRWLERVNGLADKIFDAHLDLALGHYAETQTAEGSVKVYKRPPDARSLHWIMEQVWGKAGNLSLPVDSPNQKEDRELTDEEKRSISWAIQCAIPQSMRDKSAPLLQSPHRS